MPTGQLVGQDMTSFPLGQEIEQPGVPCFFGSKKKRSWGDPWGIPGAPIQHLDNSLCPFVYFERAAFLHNSLGFGKVFLHSALQFEKNSFLDSRIFPRLSPAEFLPRVLYFSNAKSHIWRKSYQENSILKGNPRLDIPLHALEFLRNDF